MHRLLLVAALSTLVAAVGPARAAARNNPLSQPLSDARINKVLPVLRAEADAVRKDATALRDAALAPPSSDPRSNRPTPAATVPFALARELKRAGVSGEEYEDVKIALALARDDARDPRFAGAAQLPADGSEQQAREVDALRRMLDVRRQNAELYRRRAGELAPLLGPL